MRHHRLTEQEKNFLWLSWRKGHTFEAIGGKIGKTAASGFFYLQRYGASCRCAASAARTR